MWKSCKMKVRLWKQVVCLFMSHNYGRLDILRKHVRFPVSLNSLFPFSSLTCESILDFFFGVVELVCRLRSKNTYQWQTGTHNNQTMRLTIMNYIINNREKFFNLLKLGPTFIFSEISSFHHSHAYWNSQKSADLVANSPRFSRHANGFIRSKPLCLPLVSWEG